MKEIGWAIQFGKPIIIIQEVEARFFPFDVGRWQRDECVRDTEAKWKKGWVQTKYVDQERIAPEVCDLPSGIVFFVLINSKIT